MTPAVALAYLHSMEIRLLDPHDDTQMRRFHEIGWRAEKEDGRPWNTFWTYDELSILFREPTDDQQFDAMCLFEDDRMVAGGVVGMSLLDNVDKAWVFPAVEPELRRHGLGGTLVRALVDRASEAGRTQLISATAVPFAERETSGFVRFAATHGFRLANTEIIRILRLPMADELLDEIRRESVPHHEGYSVATFVDELPDELLESYSHLLNQLALDAPTGDIDFEAEQSTPDIERQKLQRNKRAGRTSYISVAVKDGEAVAHSDLVLPPTGTQAIQMGTLVRRDHRGHRLGNAVKVANLEALQRDRPDITEVNTQNAETNAAMVSINERLGFEPVAVCPEFLRTV